MAAPICTPWVRWDYFMLTGEQVFSGNIVEICGHHLHTDPTPPSDRARA